LKVLLHACCAPCLIHPVEVLRSEGREVVVFFYNPNVHPYREYERRFLAVATYCEGGDLDLRVGPYEMERYFASVAVEPEARCRHCFRLRLSRAAYEARSLGITGFTTTLLVSPHQDRELLIEAGEQAGIEHGVLFESTDFRDGFRAGEERARELEIYRQSYCGCVFSEKERYQKEDPPRR